MSLIRKSLSLILAVTLIFTSVVPAMAEIDYESGDAISSYSDTDEISEVDDVSNGAENWNDAEDGVSEQQMTDGSEDMPEISNAEEPGDTVGNPNAEEPDDVTTPYPNGEWDGTYFNVTYDANGGTGSYTATDIKPGETHAVLTVSTSGISSPVTGCIFDSWNTAADGSGMSYSAGDSFIVEGDITLYAQWQHDGYTYYRVTYMANGGTGSKIITNVLPGSYHIVRMLSATGISRPGYYLTGWNTAADGSGISYAERSKLFMRSDVTLYAQYEGGVDYTLTYKSNDIRGLSYNAAVKGGSAYIVLGQTDTGISDYVIGFTFAGWNTAANGSGTSYRAGDFITVNGDITLYAQWVYDGTIWCSLQLLANGGTGAYNGSFLPGTTYTLPSAASINIKRAGYTFTGWNTELNGSGTSYAAGDTITLDANNLVLYAQWVFKANAAISVTYDANGGTGGTKASVAVGSYHTILSMSTADVSRCGYKLKSWNTAEDGSGTGYTEGSNAKFDDSVTLYAQWIHDGSTYYSVTYDANGGTGSYTATDIKPDETHAVLTVSTAGISSLVTGCIFDSWNTASDGSGTSYSAGDSITVEGDITLYAQWQHDGYTYYRVTYMANGGTGSKIITNVLPGSYHIVRGLLATGINRPGYYLTGWNTAADGSGISYAERSKLFMRSDVTLYAQYEGGVDYTLTYKSNDIRGLSYNAAVKGGSTNIVLGQTDTGISDYVIGFTFAGWNTAANGGGTSYRAGDFITVNGDMTLYAQWVHDGTIWCKLQFLANGGTGAYNGTFLPGATYTIPSAASLNIKRAGYTFTGWNTELNGSGTSYDVGQTITFSTEQLILYAQWTR